MECGQVDVPGRGWRGRAMTEDEWVQQALSTLPPMSPTKKVRLALLFREEPSVANGIEWGREHGTTTTVTRAGRSAAVH
jgi:hypothetical protein